MFRLSVPAHNVHQPYRCNAVNEGHYQFMWIIDNKQMRIIFRTTLKLANKPFNVCLKHNIILYECMVCPSPVVLDALYESRPLVFFCIVSHFHMFDCVPKVHRQKCLQIEPTYILQLIFDTFSTSSQSNMTCLAN